MPEWPIDNLLSSGNAVVFGDFGCYFLCIFYWPPAKSQLTVTEPRGTRLLHGTAIEVLVRVTVRVRLTLTLNRNRNHAAMEQLRACPTCLTSLRIPRPNYSSPSQRPSFEHAGLTCYTLLSSSITFLLFHSELKTYLFRKSYPPP